MLSQISRRVGRECWSKKSSLRHVGAPLRNFRPNLEWKRELSSLRSTISSYTPRRSGTLARFNSTAPAPSEKETNEQWQEGIAVDATDYRPTYIGDAEAAAIVSRAKEAWPCPPGDIPEGWSCAWEKWSLLFTLYWFSPYYLMLPQIEMLVNITYGIPGEARPIMYNTPKEEGSKGKDFFFFTMVEDVDKEKREGRDKEREFYLCDCSAMELYKIDVPRLTELKLVEMLGADPTLEGSNLSMQKLQPSEEGLDAIRRILTRDETVIPILAEKFLDYTPEPTEEWQERPELGKEGDENKTEDEHLEELKRLMGELESRAPELKAASEAWDRGFKSTDVGEDSESGSKKEAEMLQLLGSGFEKELDELAESLQTAEEDLSKLETKAKNTDSQSQSDDLGDLADINLKELGLENGKSELEVKEVEEDHMKVSMPFKGKE